MKRDYMKPAMRVCELKQKCHILVGSESSETMNTLNSNFTNEEGELIYEGGGEFEAR